MKFTSTPPPLRRSLHCLALAALGLVFAQPAAHATLIIGAEQYDPGVGPSGPPSIINCVSNDLLQTSLSSATGELSSEWRSGLYADAVTYLDSPFVTTYGLNVASNPSGYDIKEIRVFSGWDSYRSGQSYDILYSLVEAPDTFLTLGAVLTPSGHNGAVMTRTCDSSAGALPDAGSPIPLLSGVARIRFNFRPNGLGAVYREIDVTGSPTPTGAPKNITSFTFPTSGEASIAGTNINITMPYGTAVNALAPTYTLSHGATCVPASGSTQNFSSPVQYVVTASDNSTKTYTVTVALRAIPDPVFTLTAPATWDGRQTINVTPDISNWSALVAAGGSNLTYHWTVAGLAVTKQITPPAPPVPGSLTLTRSQGSGPLTVTLVLDNGGVLVTQSKTITVQEPATEAWVQRTPDPNEKPVTHQFFARDGTTGKGTIHYNGTQNGATAVFLKVYTTPAAGTETQYGTTLRQTLTGGGAYAFTVPIDAGLVKYRVEFGTRSGTTDTVTATVTDLVCGDAYLINGQSNAVAYNYGNFTDLTNYTYTSTWIRSFGTHGEGGQGSELNGGWGNADQINEFGGGIRFVGYWGMHIAKQLVDHYQIPICILQGAVGGTQIYQHMPNAANHADPATIYGRLLERVQAARLTHGIRGMMWHQGESDSGNSGPDGDSDYKFYRQYFLDLSAAWKLDYPNIRYYYTFQVWPKPCEMGPHGDQIREIQRTLPNLYSNLRVMSTVGVDPEVYCHTDLDGYVRFGQLLGPLIEQDNYGYVPTAPITAPNLKRAYFTTPNRTEIALEFGQNMAWNNASASLIFLDGVGGKVTSGSVSGNVIKLQVTGAQTSQTISYLMDQVWNQSQANLQANLIYGTNSVAALTFSEVPIALTALPTPTGLSASANNNQVVLNWTAPSGATGYNVKRALSSGGPYSVIGTSSGNSYTDTTGTNGTTYFYVVSATSGTDQSADSVEASATINVIGTGVTTTTLARHTGTGSSSTYGAALGFDVTVSGSSTPTGMVTLKDGGAAGTTLGSATLAAGACTITTTTLAAGSHANIVAVYAGDSNFAASTSSALSPAQTVNPATPVVTVTGTTSFTYNASAQGPNTATTGGSTGTVTFSYVGVNGTTYPASSTPPTNVGSYTCTATVAADSNHTSASSGATPFTIAKATPVITWANPSPINVGTALGAIQLNATSGGVAGNFVYTPASGAVLALGSHTLSTQFTPTATANYIIPAAKTVTIQVSVSSVVFGAEQYQANGADPSPTGVAGGDLLEMAGVVATGEPATISGVSPALRSGSFGDFVMYNDSSTYTTTYVLAPNTLGYDITEIRLFSNGGSRTGQSYDIKYSLKSDPGTFLLLGTYTDTLYGGASGTLMTRSYNAGGSALRSGVAAVQFVIRPTQIVGETPARFIGALYREWDVLGTATVGVANTYESWAAAQVPPVTGGANGDSDHDGIPNLVEYALLLNPAAADGPPGSFDGSFLSFSKRDAAVTNGDVTYAIQISTSLAAESWTEVSAYVENSSTTISCTLPAAVGGRVFARLIVTQTS